MDENINARRTCTGKVNIEPPPKRRKHPKRYVQLGLKLVENYVKNILDIIKIIEYNDL
ncbi:MAG: hypothetical protein LBK94_11100 [Prevotellaceae bacterium]|jgi:hypothetical protein|nr:hypothetical protein [Prevotellaceae bacterium]